MKTTIENKPSSATMHVTLPAPTLPRIVWAFRCPCGLHDLSCTLDKDFSELFSGDVCCANNIKHFSVRVTRSTVYINDQIVESWLVDDN